MNQFDNTQLERLHSFLEEFKNCTICPRNCAVNRFEEHGYCNSGVDISVSTVCLHTGEEPAIIGDKGVCNVFFSRCNLQCIYCQNCQISSVTKDIIDYHFKIEEIVDMIIPYLNDGVGAVGFVSPSHVVPHVKMIVTALRMKGYHPVFVYNTNAYEKVETIRQLDEYIDVFLPDFKYAENDLALSYSEAADYPEVALAAIREMKRLKGVNLIVNEHGYATSGVIVRHLILPNQAENSMEVLRRLAIEITPMITISLMSQYYPTYKAIGHPELDRQISPREYEAVQAEMERLGLSNGWWQDFESPEFYRPDFTNEEPFEEK